ncbi:MAG: circadian clock protein KaiA [Leptolyngbyaceae cyanobacterium RU_5_1]|nr:circadian clock protein KaiA [Leptolyngbyaceae cyanobacterium RU_5_1]
MPPRLSICTFLTLDTLNETIAEALSRDRYIVTSVCSNEEFFKFIEHEKQQLDCLILQSSSELPQIANWLHGQATLLPAVILHEDSQHSQQSDDATAVRTTITTPIPSVDETNPHPQDSLFTYHTAELHVTTSQLRKIDHSIDQAIAQFINLSPACRVNSATSTADVTQALTTQNFLLLQQRRLTEKLKERLGYLGVYYKRDPKNFFRHLPPDQKQELLEKLRSDYRDIVLCYFADDNTLNQRIDDFVNTTFFTDISASQIVEIHMELMDSFSKQLKLEGRSEEILLDYRLTLIDTIAHLCEMYRRSIPRET